MKIVRSTAVLKVCLVLTCMAALSACSDQGAATQSRAQELAERSPVIANVDGEPIPLALLEVFAAARQSDLDDPEIRSALIRELGTQLTLRQQAQRTGLLDEVTVLAQLELTELDVISRATVNRFLQDNPVSDEQILEHYQRQALLDGNREYRVRHILVRDESLALSLVDRALDGEDFEALIAEAAPQAIQARDLGWVRVGQLPPEFGEAMIRAADNRVLPTPVLSDFGYHVIQRLESRGFNPPPLETVSDGIRATLTERAAREYVDALQSRTQINERP